MLVELGAFTWRRSAMREEVMTTSAVRLGAVLCARSSWRDFLL
jgi:hypothetical protein